MSITAAVIDSREPKWVQGLSFNGAMVATGLLDAGDLLAICDDGTLLAIERKTPDDLLNSIRDERLWAQLAGLCQVTRWAYLVVTGELRQGPDGKVVTDARGTGWNWASVQGALLQAQEMGIFIVHCAGDEDYEAAVLRLATRSHRAEVVVSPAREPRILAQAEQILCALPGIGWERMQALMQHCGNAAWAMNYLTSIEASDIPGIGPGTRRAIRKALGLKEDEELAVVIAETGQLAQEQAA
jgi:ERCC4-type nuclease